MSLGAEIVASCAADKGRDTYSQARRQENGYSDCSWYVRRKFLEFTGIDVGTYTAEIANSLNGRTLTASASILRTGIGLQDADVVLWGWATDHRIGYPYSHVGIYDKANNGTWDQYGDLPPHNGPNFHGIDWGLSKADRILVRRFIPNEPASSVTLRADWVLILQRSMNRQFPTYSRLAEDGIYGAKTRSVVIEFQRRTQLLADGIVGPKTIAKLAHYGIKLTN